MQYETTVIVPHGNVTAQLKTIREQYICSLQSDTDIQSARGIFWPFFPLCAACPPYLDNNSVTTVRTLLQQQKMEIQILKPVQQDDLIYCPVIFTAQNNTSAEQTTNSSFGSLYLAFSTKIPDLRKTIVPAADSSLLVQKDSLRIRVFQIQRLRICAPEYVSESSFAQNCELIDSCWVKIK